MLYDCVFVSIAVYLSSLATYVSLGPMPPTLLQPMPLTSYIELQV